ncbi:MAG TPA: hypothetical protein VIX73_34675, partial [Kofleriaceae bacterium]
FGDSLALGASLAAARVRVTEQRRIFAARGGVTLGAPIGDVDLLFDATDPMSVSAVAGLLYAPLEAPIELGASASWTRTVSLDGTLDARPTQSGPPLVTTAAPTASLRIAQPIAVRAGGRYVGDRIVAELDGDMWIAPRGSEATAWQVSGVRVTAPSYPGVDLWRIPSRISQHTHLAVRTALDVSIVPGFLWVTSGYAFSNRVTPAAQMSPSFGDLGGHTVALGLEATAGGVTATLGWSRTWSPESHASSALRMDNPFYGVDGPVPAGTYSGQVDQVGVLIDAELGSR